MTATPLSPERLAEIERLCDEWPFRIGEPRAAVDAYRAIPELLAEVSRLREELGHATAHDGDWLSKTSRAMCDTLLGDRDALREQVRRLTAALALARAYSPFSSEPCPLCDGETCAMHRQMDEQSATIARLARELDSGNEAFRVVRAEWRKQTDVKDARIAALEAEVARRARRRLRRHRSRLRRTARSIAGRGRIPGACAACAEACERTAERGAACAATAGRVARERAAAQAGGRARDAGRGRRTGSRCARGDADRDDAAIGVARADRRAAPGADRAVLPRLRLSRYRLPVLERRVAHPLRLAPTTRNPCAFYPANAGMPRALPLGVFAVLIMVLAWLALSPAPTDEPDPG